MKIFYSKNHYKHHPDFEIFEGGIKLPVFDSPSRVDSIISALKNTQWAEILMPENLDLKPILEVHDVNYVTYMQSAFNEWMQQGGELGLNYQSSVLIPASFPPRRSHKIPKSLFGRAGYYTIGTNAPIVAGTYQAAIESAHCAVSAARAVSDGERAAFALCRPPGHHAGKDYCGGYCFFNNAAIAARWLSSEYKTAILDIDYHAGNGTQDIFYDSPDVLTISIHADPINHFPSFMGYADETGEKAGKGYHRNFPLPAGTNDTDYLNALAEALLIIQAFAPSVLVVSVGMDLHKDDPISDFQITTNGIREIGYYIAALRLPVVLCMEGGYDTHTLGKNIVTLLSAFV